MNALSLEIKLSSFIPRLLQWAMQFDHFAYLNPYAMNYCFGTFPHLLAVGESTLALNPTNDIFQQLYQHWKESPSWLFGHFSYDLKNRIEQLESLNPDLTFFPEVSFFRPTYLFFLDSTANMLKIVVFDSKTSPQQLFEKINTHIYAQPLAPKGIVFRELVDYSTYHEKVSFIKQRIVEGDFYELNYCINFLAENAIINPISTYEKLNQLSPTPFSTLYRHRENWLLCASPERFLKKQGELLISQPIKGTIRRGSNAEEDAKLVAQLHNSEKERAENVMIVDLVRNDLTRSSQTGTVNVPELFKVYTFKTVHQLISTVVGKIRPDLPFTEAIKNAFPMGSMTGAPKIKAMQIIDKVENRKRNLFSGAVGYISPEGDFDFNVVIRSLFYNQQRKELAYWVGSAITYDADIKNEHEECLLKAQAIRQLF
ncbi:MAG: anthranilate synthase component I family protein [Flammeovirgaceae bacterium]|nr:anthranilate synthase component I family protein [Flammeovirgaceae bacterium]